MNRLLSLVMFFASLALSAQQLRIASYNMERLGEDRKDYITLAKVISSFDVVAAEEVMNASGMESVLQQLGKTWSDKMSETGEGSTRYKEYFGFFYDDKVALVRMLGAYPDAKEFFRPPYGAEFKVKGSDLTFNLVACHIIYGKSERARVAETSHLGEVHQYFEHLTGDRGITIIAGDFNEERIQDFESLIDLGDEEAIPTKGTTIGTHGPDHAYDHMFVSAALRQREVTADVDYWTTDFAGTRKSVSDHFPVFIVLKTSK